MPCEQTILHLHREEGKFLDSIEIGTPSKGGAVKVYFDARDPEGAKMKVDNAMMIRIYAKTAMEVTE